MASTHVIVTDETKFDATLAQAQVDAKANNQQLYVYITGAVVPETGKSWCPDCVAAVPFLETVKKQPGNYVIECPVERTKYKGIPVDCSGEEGCKIQKHPYKTHEKFKVTSIPTLYKFDMANIDEKPARLVEADCYNAAKIAAFTGIDQSAF
eukprot:UN02935